MKSGAELRSSISSTMRRHSAVDSSPSALSDGPAEM
jgi:hypothetical protein